MLTIFGTSGYIDNNTNSNDNIFLQEMPFDNCVFTTRLIGKPYANWQPEDCLHIRMMIII